MNISKIYLSLHDRTVNISNFLNSQITLRQIFDQENIRIQQEIIHDEVVKAEEFEKKKKDQEELESAVYYMKKDEKNNEEDDEKEEEQTGQREEDEEEQRRQHEEDEEEQRRQFEEEKRKFEEEEKRKFEEEQKNENDRIMKKKMKPASFRKSFFDTIPMEDLRDAGPSGIKKLKQPERGHEEGRMEEERQDEEENMEEKQPESQHEEARMEEERQDEEERMEEERQDEEERMEEERQQEEETLREEEPHELARTEDEQEESADEQLSIGEQMGLLKIIIRKKISNEKKLKKIQKKTGSTGLLPPFIEKTKFKYLKIDKKYKIFRLKNRTVWVWGQDDAVILQIRLPRSVPIPAAAHLFLARTKTGIMFLN